MCSKGSSDTCIKVCTCGLLTEIILQAGREILVGQAPTQHEEGHQNLLHRVVQELLRVMQLTLASGRGRRIPHRQEDCLSCLRQRNTAFSHLWLVVWSSWLPWLRYCLRGFPRLFCHLHVTVHIRSIPVEACLHFFTGIMPEWDPLTQKAFSPK